jgi:hypothetical protein
MATLLEQAHSASVQASSPSAQVKAAVAKIGDHNWNWEKKILYSTMGVVSDPQSSSDYNRIYEDDLTSSYSDLT